MQLPFPILDEDSSAEIEREVIRVKNKGFSDSAYLDSLIFKSFNLSGELIAYIEKEVGK